MKLGKKIVIRTVLFGFFGFVLNYIFARDSLSFERSTFVIFVFFIAMLAVELVQNARKSNADT